MSQLIVRNLDETIVQALKEQAARHGRSAEAEHREILKEALAPDPPEDLKTMFLAMPDVGEDSDFERIRSLPRRLDL